MRRRRTTTKQPGNTQRQRDGAMAEQLAAQHVTDHGVSIVTRNFRSRLGEIDLVALDEPNLAFIEVRYRGIASLGCAAASVTAHKQRRILQTARFFLSRFPQWHAMPLRFDVIAIDQVDQNEHTLNWIRNAFDASAMH
ncbi:MAG: YraN family protein [Pseudomonadota bacterium]